MDKSGSRGAFCPLSHMLRMCCRAMGVGAFVNRIKPHDLHQVPNTVATGMIAVSWQVCGNLAAAQRRILGENLVDLAHQFQRFGAEPDRGVIQR